MELSRRQLLRTLKPEAELQHKACEPVPLQASPKLFHLVIVMSQTNIKETYFLENCINKKRTVQDIYEALALYSETTDTRKEPVFVVAEANDLHRRIKEHAENIKGVYRNEREAMLSDLVKDDMFANEVEELGEQYGKRS